MALGSQRQMKRERSESGEELESRKQSLDVNSMVQITLDKGNPVSGIIRWLGYMPKIEHKMAGVELVSSKIMFLFSKSTKVRTSMSFGGHERVCFPACPRLGC